MSWYIFWIYMTNTGIFDEVAKKMSVRWLMAWEKSYDIKDLEDFCISGT